MTARLLRVATYNLDGLGGRTFVPGAPRFHALRGVLFDLEADILGLQEVNAQAARAGRGRTLAALDELVRGTDYEGFHRSMTTLRDGHGPLDVHNLVILSRYPLKDRRQFWHDLVPAPVHRPITAEPSARALDAQCWDRPILYAAVDIDGGKPLHLFNLHLRAPLAAFIEGQKETAFAWKSVRGWAEGFYLAALKRTGQALEARLAVDALLDKDIDARIIVCGDMNADLVEMPVRLLAAAVDDTGNPALADRALFSIERIAPEADRYSVIHAGHRHMLDHILVSRVLSKTCRRVEILNRDLPDEVFDEEALGEIWPSNHAPIVAEFEIES